MTMIFIFIIGIAVGSVMTIIITKPRPIGVLRIDTSDPDSPPYLFVELSRGIGDIASKGQVIFDVKVENLIPPK